MAYINCDCGVNLLNAKNLSDSALKIWNEQIWKEHYIMSR